jgi:hypothetical protein
MESFAKAAATRRFSLNSAVAHGSIPTPLAAPLTFETPAADSLPEGATVLLMDDESALVHAIGEFLRDSGYIFSMRSLLRMRSLSPRSIRDESIS